jgi:hypothetical protein
MHVVIRERKWQVVGFENIAVLSSAIGLNAGLAAAADFVLLNPVTQNVRYRDDGTNPTATVGILLATTLPSPFVYYGPLTAIKLIQTAATATLNVAYYKWVNT